MIYVPDYLPDNCAYMQSNNILRVYETVPQHGSTISYRDYMVDNHYLYRDGVTTFSQYSTLPTCINSADITTFYGYRTDISDILITFIIIVGFIFFVVSKLWRVLFKGGRIL